MKFSLFIQLVLLFVGFSLMWVPLEEAQAKLKAKQESKAKVRKKAKKKRIPKRRRYRRKRRRPAKKAPAAEVVDLDSLEEDESSSKKASRSSSSHSYGRPMTPSSGPMFKAYFDLLFTNRPGHSPPQFDTFHSILLVDFIPTAGVLFTTEIPVAAAGNRPVPRFFELDLDLSRKLQIRLGKIWIPFDQLDPHHTFGGIMNTSELFGPGQNSFLPDIWADLGVGFKLKLADRRGLNIETHFYVVNGFKDGAVDPANSSNTVYPGFADPAIANDNNADKAVGGRIHGMFANMIGVGFSAYTGCYTSRPLDCKRVNMLGVDAQLRFPSKTDFRAGYAYMKVGLVPGTSVTTDAPNGRENFMRGGAYAQVSQRLGKFRVSARGGIQNNDSGVEDPNDRVILGGRVAYDFTPMFQLSFESFKDVKEVAGKTQREYSAVRFVIKM